jgi:hypothetical protein
VGAFLGLLVWWCGGDVALYATARATREADRLISPVRLIGSSHIYFLQGESAELVFTPAWMGDLTTVLSDLDMYFPSECAHALPEGSNSAIVASIICVRMSPAMSPSCQPRNAFRIFAHASLYLSSMQCTDVRTGCVCASRFDPRAKQSNTRTPIPVRLEADD